MDSDDDSSVCDGAYSPQLPVRKQYLCFQITPHDDTISKELILDYFTTKKCSAIIGEEYASNRHFHILLGHDGDYSKTKVRCKDLYAPLYDLMNTPAENRKGNKIFRWDGIFKDNYGIYSLKDGDYVSTDDLKEIAFHWATLSYEKPKGLKKDKALLLQEFANSQQKFEDLLQPFYNGLCEIYEKYDTGYNYSKIDDIVLMARNKKYPEYREKDVKKRIKKFLSTG